MSHEIYLQKKKQDNYSILKGELYGEDIVFICKYFVFNSLYS